MDEKQKLTEPAGRKERFWRWLAGPRLVAITSSVGVLVILATAGSIWLTNNNSSLLYIYIASYKTGAY